MVDWNIKKKFTQKWKKLSFYQKGQLIIMLFVGVLAFVVACKQASISERLLKLEELDRDPVLSIEIGNYDVGNYQGDANKESIIINPIFKNTGQVPISILGSGFYINKADSFGRTFIAYQRGQSGINIEPGGQHTLRYEIRASEDNLASYRFDVRYKKEPNGQEKCLSLILSRGKDILFQDGRKKGCPI